MVGVVGVFGVVRESDIRRGGAGLESVFLIGSLHVHGFIIVQLYQYGIIHYLQSLSLFFSRRCIFVPLSNE